jgi:hypothetical protein
MSWARASVLVVATAEPARRGGCAVCSVYPLGRAKNFGTDSDYGLAAINAQHLAFNFSQLKLARCPHSLAPTLVALPSISAIPFLDSEIG